MKSGKSDMPGGSGTGKAIFVNVLE